MLKIVDEPEGATPLTPDDMQGLRYQHLETRAQLNELVIHSKKEFIYYYIKCFSHM